MKRLLFLFIMPALVLTMQAQDRTFESCPLELIAENWKNKTIEHVVNGSLGIMLEAFDKTWPTYVVAEARDVMEKGLEKYVDPNDETERTVINDAKNGFVRVYDAGTDSEYMSACYEEYTWTLRPEPNILVGLPPKPRDGQRYFSLPQKGKDLIVTDFVDGNRHEHLMKWNGMRPIYTSTTIKKGYNDDEK